MVNAVLAQRLFIAKAELPAPLLVPEVTEEWLWQATRNAAYVADAWSLGPRSTETPGPSISAAAAATAAPDETSET